MADDKQLTVAELLARNKASKGTDSASGEKPKRRRRRRNLDEGGISVAELTGSLNKVNSAPHEAKHSSVPMDSTAPVIPAPKEKKAVDAPAAETKHAGAQAAGAKKADTTQPAASAQSGAAAGSAHQPSDDATVVIQKVTDDPAPPAAHSPASVGGQELAGEDSSAEADTARDTVLDAEGEDEKLNPVAVVLLAVIGIVLGAVVFKGFEILWDRFHGALVAVLAVLVTGIMVGVVHAMRTARDGFSMGLAGVVGLLLTFGPLLIFVL